MATHERDTRTYTLTVAAAGPFAAKLEAHGELVSVGEPRLDGGRPVVDVVARGRAVVDVSPRGGRWPVQPARQPRRRRAVVGVVVSFPAAGAAGYVAGVLGADAIAQAVAALGTTGAVGFLVYAVATVWHRVPGHHCPGCRDH